MVVRQLEKLEEVLPGQQYRMEVLETRKKWFGRQTSESVTYIGRPGLWRLYGIEMILDQLQINNLDNLFLFEMYTRLQSHTEDIRNFNELMENIIDLADSSLNGTVNNEKTTHDAVS